MSTIAEITVKQCDSCGGVMTVSHAHAWETFRVLWYDGFMVDFCSACKVLPRNLERIGEDLAERKNAIGAIERAKTLTEAKHVN